jgi:FSR family fosmidomycin resistance protein-like MFS transporter
MATSLASDLLLIPLLEKLPGRWVIRTSATVTSLIYPAMLFSPWLPFKIFLAVALRFTTLGWYSVLQGEAYATLPGRSGTVMALNAISGVIGGAMAWLTGWVAAQAGLPVAMWLLLLGPLSLVLFVPRPARRQTSTP